MSGTNANVARGLVPYAFSWGEPYNGAVTVVYIPSSDTNAIYVGDPVVYTQSTADANGVPGVTIGQAGAHAISGVMVGVANNAGELVLPVLQSTAVYRPASTAQYLYMACDPNLLYWIQEDSSGGSMANTSGGGQLANLVAGAGSTYTGFSGWQLQSSSLGSGAQLAVMQALQQVDNYIGNQAKWLVRVVDRLPTF